MTYKEWVRTPNLYACYDDYCRAVRATRAYLKREADSRFIKQVIKDYLEELKK